MTKYVIAYFALQVLGFVAADVSHLPIVQQQKAAADVPQAGSAPVTESCLGCICEAMSECKVTQCEGGVCGLFRLTWSYWADAGKPTLAGELPTSETAYANCANDPYCAATAVQGYMSKYGNKDCNGDGKIDCRDYMNTHYLGGYNCVGQLPPIQGARFEQCMKQLGI